MAKPKGLWWESEYDRLWDALVPKRGQADTVQGELLRAIGRLEGELKRNGNINWNPQFVRLVEFLRRHLLAPGALPPDAAEQVAADLEEIVAVGRDHLRWTPVDGGPDVYERVSERVVEWCRSHPEPIPREHDPDLKM